MKSRVFPVLLSLFAFIIAGCSSPSAAAQPATVLDQVGLIAALQAAGATAEAGGSVNQDFFSPVGSIIKANGVDVQVFEYDSVEAMESEASQVSSDGGSVGTSMVMWMDAPHFYKSGRIIVLYVGSDQKILELLEKAMGQQFAGR